MISLRTEQVSKFGGKIKEAAAHHSLIISQDKNVKKSVKTAQSSNWILCPRPARLRLSLHGALEGKKNSPNASEVLWAFSPLDLISAALFFLIPLHCSHDQIYPSTAAKSIEIKTFTCEDKKGDDDEEEEEEKEEEKLRSVSCSGAWKQREPGRSAHNKPVVNLAVKICLKKTANCCMKCIQV